MADNKDDLTAKAHFDPTWISWNGGYLHSNNVLFYFATSPFFDQVSGNQSLFTQWAGTPNQNDILGTRAKFEKNLRHQRGIQYVVEHDPLEEKVFFDGPNGREASNVWVIRKQNRENESDAGVTVLGYYYIVNDVIYQAPSVASVLNYRLLNTVSSLNKLFAPSDLSYFSVSHGHTYHKPVQPSSSQALSGPAQASKDATPMPGTQSTTTDKPTASSKGQEDGDSGIRTAWDALRMTLQYGKEYVDEVPLVGEPGSFRFSKSNQPATGQAKGQPTVSGVATATPGQSRAPSVVATGPSLPVLGPKVDKAGDNGLSVPDGPSKGKPRKSKAGESSP